MKEANFLYTDGRNVVVTPSFLQIKGSHYYLRGITEFGLALLKPQRLPGLLITLIGLGIIAEKFLQFIPVSWYDALTIPYYYSYSSILLIIGIVITLIGITYMAVTRRRYALRIETAEGNKLVIISKSKQYVDQILTALRKARLISKLK